MIGGGVVALICLVQAMPRWWAGFELPERFERVTYDWRMRQSQHWGVPAATNLAAVLISDDSIAIVNDGVLGFRCGLYWPRHVYGRMIRELARQGALAVGCDILLGELRPDHPPVREPGGSIIGSDAFLARELRAAGNVLLAARSSLPPTPLFFTNACAVGDVSADADSDGVLRRARAYMDYRLWHPHILRAARLLRCDLNRAVAAPGRILLKEDTEDRTAVQIELDAQGRFEVTTFLQTVLPGEDEGGPARWEPAFEDRRIWNLGLALAARAMGLDLDKAAVNLHRREIVLHGPGGQYRIIPVDREGHIYFDWGLTPWDSRLTKAGIEQLLAADVSREAGDTNDLAAPFAGQIVVVGSVATGNDLTDVVATPISPRTYGLSQHWNVANALILNRFIRPYSYGIETVLILVLGTLAAWLTWSLRAVWASVCVLLLTAGYVGISIYLLAARQFWLPVVLPVGGALLTMHVTMVTYRVIFEQQERRRVRSVFSKMVAPEVVQELLSSQHLRLGGARRRITVFFADVRGFTELTDRSQAEAEEYVRTRQLSAEAAEHHYSERAAELLATVNLYLGMVADTIKQHRGTLDKYIGDCVMAFWGAPVPEQKHAMAGVQAARAAQQAIAALNQERERENQRRIEANQSRLEQGRPELPLLPLLALGTGLNTGIATVGLMGSDAHILNYTVFGREVNLASRLEGVSGRSRIIISEATLSDLRQDDAELAARCRELEPVHVKGITQPVRVFEVPWRIEAG